MQADTTFATDLLTYGHVAPNTAEQRRSNFEHSGSGTAPSSVPIAIPTPHIGSLGLVGNQTSAPVVFLTVNLVIWLFLPWLILGQYITSSKLTSYLSYETNPPLFRLFLASCRFPCWMGVWFRQLNWPLWP